MPRQQEAWMEVCDGCLRSSYLLAFLSSDVQTLLVRAGARSRGVPDPRLILDALGPKRRRQAEEYTSGFSSAGARDAICQAGLSAICRCCPDYPVALVDLDQPPPVLYATSMSRLLEACQQAAAAVVGTRQPSEYGRGVAYRLGRGLGAAGVPVISGMALGIDAHAHRGCLDSKGLTVAVLAGGADQPYPRSNRAVYERIRDTGSVVSELPPGTRPCKWLFPARNRIMAALGRVTIVVEAAERSGTLITVDHATDLGRDVAAVPGWVTARVAVGTNGLLRTGAAVVTNTQDVLDLMFGAGERQAADSGSAPPKLDAQEARVLDLVGQGAAVPELADQTGLDAQRLRTVLARLELAGLVERRGAGTYAASAGAP